jgi:two-component system sensor histidine kinase YesM
MFLVGLLVITSISKNSLEYIYQLTDVILEDSASQIQTEINSFEDISYNIITDDTIQESGTNLLKYFNNGLDAIAYDKAVSLNNITNAIRRQTQSSRNIVCSNYVSPEGNNYVVALSKYIKPEIATLDYIIERAKETDGSSAYIFLEEEYPDYMVVARLIREKHNMSFNEIGVVFFFVDMRQIALDYMNSNEYSIIIENKENNIRYSYLEEANQLMVEEAMDSRNHYPSLWKIGKESYIVRSVQPKASLFRYIILAPATNIYNVLAKGVRILLFVYVIGLIVVMLVSIIYVQRAMGELKYFVNYIKSIPIKTIHLDEYNGRNTYVDSLEMHNISTDEISELKESYDNMIQTLNKLIKENYMQMLWVKEAQIYALQAQFNPHFLNNTLNSIYWMSKNEKNMKVADMAAGLGVLMKEAIASKEFVVSVKKELEILDNYIVIQKLRYGKRLSVTREVDDRVYNKVIPKFTLQPLVENAIYYGVESNISSCVIAIKIYEETNYIFCEVFNSGSQVDDDIMQKLRKKEINVKGNGIGLLNIEDRIKSLFGEASGIEILNLEDAGVIAKVKLRNITMDDYMEKSGIHEKPESNDC